jgi:SAM-dependent methyltransferase
VSATSTLRLDAAREEAELAAYLGERYQRSTLENYQDVLDREVAQVADEHELYRTSQAYLYNLTAFAMTGTKLPYLEQLVRHVPPGAKVLDYGCGIGSDGLMLLEAGYKVEFADFDNPSTAYLRWRLEHRSLDAAIHDLDQHVPGGFDAAFAFDVIEHVAEPYDFLARMEERAALVVVNFLEYDENEQDLHYELPIPELLRYTADRGLVAYRLMHGTSHLVLYRPERVGPPQKAINRLRVAARRVRA